MPCLLKKLNAIAPPIMIRSATPRKRSITPILSFTFAPPSTSRRGDFGSSRTAVSSVTSRSSRSPPYAGSRRATPAVVACARWAAPKASSTYTSASRDNAVASSGSSSISPGSNRLFSSISTSPGPSSSASASTSGPTTPGARRTSVPSSSPSRAATGFIDRSGSRPSGRPRCDTRMSFAPRLRRSSIVGNAARIRESSATSPSASGTSKSTRRSTRRPSTSASRTLALVKLNSRGQPRLV